jgi:acyl carrier protein
MTYLLGQMVMVYLTLKQLMRDVIDSFAFFEAIPKIEKWFQVKPPAHGA